MTETKAQAFERLFPGRVTNVVEALRILGNLAGSRYEFTEAQFDAIYEQIETALVDMSDAFNKRLGRGTHAEMDAELKAWGIIGPANPYENEAPVPVEKAPPASRPATISETIHAALSEPCAACGGVLEALTTR